MIDQVNTFQPRASEWWMFESPEMRARIELQGLHPWTVLPSRECPAAICGVVVQFGAGEAWMIPGQIFEKHVKTVLRMQRAMLRVFFETLSLRLLTMRVDVADRPAVRYAEALGFEHRATVPQIGVRGEDIGYFFWKGK